MRAAVILFILFPISFPIRSEHMEREAMWVSMDERTFEYLRLQESNGSAGRCRWSGDRLSGILQADLDKIVAE